MISYGHFGSRDIIPAKYWGAASRFKGPPPSKADAPEPAGSPRTRTVREVTTIETRHAVNAPSFVSVYAVHRPRHRAVIMDINKQVMALVFINCSRIV